MRILDGQRFDAKFFDLKEKRAARDLAAAVEPTPTVAEISEVAEEEIPIASTSKLETKEKKLKKRKLEEVTPIEAEAGVEVAEAVVVKEKKPKRAKREVVIEAGLEGETKKRKNRHDSRREASTGDATRPVGPSEPLPLVLPPPTKKVKLDVVPVKKEKRNKKVKEVKEVVVVERKKRDKNGVLSALKGDAELEAQERLANKLKKSTFTPTGTNAILSKEAEKEESKEGEKIKTSVVGVVVVKKEGKKVEKKVVDLGGLMGGREVTVAGW